MATLEKEKEKKTRDGELFVHKDKDKNVIVKENEENEEKEKEKEEEEENELRNDFSGSDFGSDLSSSLNMASHEELKNYIFSKDTANLKSALEEHSDPLSLLQEEQFEFQLPTTIPKIGGMKCTKCSLIFLAVVSKSVVILRMLVKAFVAAGIYVNEKTENGLRPLGLAVRMKEREMVKVLVEEGKVNVDDVDYSCVMGKYSRVVLETVLLMAVRISDLKFVLYFLEV